jgi:hypothetical protein
MTIVSSSRVHFLGSPAACGDTCFHQADAQECYCQSAVPGSHRRLLLSPEFAFPLPIRKRKIYLKIYPFDKANDTLLGELAQSLHARERLPGSLDSPRHSGL